jgi:hypothetical protein
MAQHFRQYAQACGSYPLAITIGNWLHGSGQGANKSCADHRQIRVLEAFSKYCPSHRINEEDPKDGSPNDEVAADRENRCRE